MSAGSKLVPGALAPEHESELVKGSAIAPKVVAARGYETETTKAQLKRLGFSNSQGGIGPWLMIPMYGPGDTIPATVQVKPTQPRPGANGKPVKYESPRGAGVVLDVNPLAQGSLPDATVPLWITEGVKKGDAIVSAGGTAISLTGVWGWKMGSLPHESWATVALDGRDVYLAFDSDALDKTGVWDALSALEKFLTKRKANVKIITLPKLHGHAKTGIDDYLASGATLKEAQQHVGPLPPRPAETRPGMAYRLEDGDTVELTNFTARIIKEILVDDGQKTTREFLIRAETIRGTFEFQIPEDEFLQMDWHIRHIGATAIIYAFPGAKDRTREAIQLESANVETITAYRHTGWRLIDGKHHYLVSNGAINEDGLRTDLLVDLGMGDRFGSIALPDAAKSKADQRLAIERSYALVHPKTGVMPLRLYAATFRATLGEVPYAIWVYGRTGAGKSTLATLLQAHWGRGHEEHKPLASWVDTDNALEEIGFRLKDMAMLVDDWRPKGRMRHREEARVDRVVRSQANASGRSRMTRTLDLRQGRDVRAAILSTGESIPQHEPSLVARLLQVELSDDRPDITERFKRMTLLQGYARRGDLAQAMTEWLMWLAPRLDEVRKKHAELMEKARDIFKANRAHARMTQMDADLYAFAQIFFGWLMSHGVILPPEYPDLLKALEEELARQGQTQEELVKEYDQTNSLVNALRVALRNDQARIDGLTSELSGLGDWIGWVEGNILYISSSSLKAMLEKVMGHAPSTQAVVKSIKDGGYYAGVTSAQDSNTIAKKYEGRAHRVIPVKETLLDEE